MRDHSSLWSPFECGSDSGPTFMAAVAQEVAEAWGTNWNLHVTYQPQSLGKVGKNKDLKTGLGKLRGEAGVIWVQALPIMLLQAQCTAYKSRVETIPF